jgi:dATP pyrophosphohydrolase
MRQPIAVLVFLFRSTPFGPEYAVFKRADDGNWQSVSGGVEADEDLPMAARREVVEETGLSRDNPMYKLDMVSAVARDAFAASVFWPAELFVVPKHYFAMDVSEDHRDLVLSQEHTQMAWLQYDDAQGTLRYDDDKTALWELNSRIWRRKLFR